MSGSTVATREPAGTAKAPDPQGRQRQRLMTARQTAEYVGMNEKALYNHAYDLNCPPALRPIRIGKRAWRWDKERIDEWPAEERQRAEERVALSPLSREWKGA